MLFATLNNGVKMPLLGFGTWKAKPGQVKEAVYNAIKVGYTHIDCAWIYENQEEVGEAISQAIDAKLVKREDLFITSKLWNSFHKKDDVEPHLKDSLKQLKLDYLDLYLIHWPATNIEAEVLTPSTHETWTAMEACYEKGLTRAIGVSNFSSKKLLDMKSYAKIFPAVNQVESHPLWNQNELLETCKSLGVHMTAYSPLGSGDSSTSADGKVLHEGASLLSNPNVLEIAKSHNKTPAQVLIKWQVSRNVSVIPKSVTPSRIESNFQVLDWELSEEALKALNSLPNQQRFIKGKFTVKAGGPYKTVAQLWDEEE